MHSRIAMRARVVGFGLVASIGLGAAQPAAAATPEVIATGLANPRGLDFAPNGALHVALAGSGPGVGNTLLPGNPGLRCAPSPADPTRTAQRCYGETGALVRIDPGAAQPVVPVVTGLPSLAVVNAATGAPGTAEGGPVDVSFQGTPYVTMSWGGDPARRTLDFGPRAALFGTLLHVAPGGRYRVVADVAAFEGIANPDGRAPDSNPYGLAALPGRRVVADAGANAVFEAAANGRVRTLAVLPPVPPPAPPLPPLVREPVPTSVVAGPDGYLYVGQLTGGPFFRGTASVWRLPPDGGAPAVYAGGFTAIVDVAFDAGGALYVLETASGFPTPPPAGSPPGTPPNPGLGAGRLKRQCPGAAPVVVQDGLTFPGGVAIGPDGAAYVTNLGTSSTAGQVLRIPLAPCGA